MPENKMQVLVDSINSFSSADFVKRLNNPTIAISNWENPFEFSTHKLSSAEGDISDIVFPNVQNVGVGYPILVDFTNPKYKMTWKDVYNRALQNGDYIEVPKGYGEYFTTHYKEYYPDVLNYLNYFK